jgi:hypothetical protein
VDFICGILIGTGSGAHAMMRVPWSRPVNDPACCRHVRTQLIAKDSDAEYVECLDCGAILEAGEREEQGPGFDESLSDA